MSPTADHQENSPPTVLVVDDEPFNVDLLTQELSILGIRSVSAVNGREALARIDRHDYDAVLLDIMMPEMDGLELLHRLKAAGRLASLPVIVVSAVDEVGQIARCIELGAEDHLLKPFDPILLRARIEGALEKKRLRDQVARQLALSVRSSDDMSRREQPNPFSQAKVLWRRPRPRPPYFIAISRDSRAWWSTCHPVMFCRCSTTTSPP